MYSAYTTGLRRSMFGTLVDLLPYLFLEPYSQHHSIGRRAIQSVFHYFSSQVIRFGLHAISLPMSLIASSSTSAANSTTTDTDTNTPTVSVCDLPDLSTNIQQQLAGGLGITTDWIEVRCEPVGDAAAAAEPGSGGSAGALSQQQQLAGPPGVATGQHHLRLQRLLQQAVASNTSSTPSQQQQVSTSGGGTHPLAAMCSSA